MTRTPEQEKQWQAAREKIALCACELCSAWRFEGTDKEHCIAHYGLCESVLPVADAILDLPGIEVRDMNTDKLLSVLALDDPEVKQRFNDLSEAFVKVVPKE